MTAAIIAGVVIGAAVLAVLTYLGAAAYLIIRDLIHGRQM
jgi:hypothetical protein